MVFTPSEEDDFVNPNGPHSRYPAGTFVRYKDKACPVLYKGHGVPPGLLPIWLGTVQLQDGGGIPAPIMTYVSLDEVSPWEGRLPCKMLSPPRLPGEPPCQESVGQEPTS